MKLNVTTAFAVLGLFISSVTFAQSPQMFNYQGVARDNAGNPLSSTDIGLKFDIHQYTANGTVIYSETNTTGTNAGGLFNLAIGQGDVVSGVFAAIDWSDGPYFLEVGLDPLDGNNYQSMGTSQLLSVPYALYAETSGNGPAGPQGPTGADGSDGATGPTGPQGPTGAFTILADTDADTRIEVEANADEDTIRFSTAGTEHFKMSAGRISVLNTGKSVFIGENAGVNDDLTDNSNVFIGFENGMSNTSGNQNTAVGAFTFDNNTTGNLNSAFGYFVLGANDTGEENAGFGVGALASNAFGSKNTAIGFSAIDGNFSGNNNTAVGHNALGQASGSGSRNTALGFEAGYISSGSDNVFIGPGAGKNSSGSNRLYIENSDSNAPLIYGNFDTDIVGINGKLGAGTQYPATELHVFAQSNPTLRLQQNAANGWDFIGGLNQLRIHDRTSGNSPIRINAGVSDNRLVLDGSFVGVGTNLPQTELHVYSTDNPTLRLQQDGAAGWDFIGNSILLAIHDRTSGNTPITINAGVSSDRLVFDGSFVGVGTNSPQTELHVDGSIRMVDGNQTAGYIPVSDGNGTMTWTNPTTISTSNDGDWTISGNNQYSAVSGNVGVGTNSASSKLHIKEDAGSSGDYALIVENISGGTYANGVKVVAGQSVHTVNSRMMSFENIFNSEIGAIRQITTSSVDYNTTSDERLKTNIKPTSKGLNDLMQIEVKDYLYKTDLDKPQTGFIAQQVYAHYPNAVSPGGDDVKTDPWMMDYGKMTPLLVKAIQDLTKLVEEQQKRIEELEKNQR